MDKDGFDQSMAVQTALMTERFLYIQRELEQNRENSKQQNERMEENKIVLLRLDHRIGNVEAALKEQAPTISEFIVIKQKLNGAGAAGKWLWTIIGGILTFIAALAAAKSGLFSLFTGK